MDDRLLDIPETGFALALEEVTDGTADPLLDHVIAVDEGKLKALRKAPANRGFAGAGQADECDRHAKLRTLRVSAQRCGR